MATTTRYAFTVPGRPVPAHRMTRTGKYLPKNARHLAHKDAIGWAAREAGVRMIDGPVRVSCAFYVHGGNVGDVDNYLKLVKDGLQGIAYENDRQVADAHGVRLVAWSKAEQRTDVWVGLIEGSDGVA